MNCADIQNKICEYCIGRRHLLTIPNFHFFHECDVLSVTKAKLAYEFEIKVSVSDFRADAKKRKHWQYRNCDMIVFRKRTPNYLYYVVPHELIANVYNRLPTHAGLCEINEAGFLTFVTDAPKLHDERVNDEKLMKIARGLMFRYWKTRGARLF